MSESLLLSKSALLSPCAKYRYRLERRWTDGPAMAFIMLNPSTADANHDDPTIRRCIGFARREGFGAMTVGNLFAWRATDARQIKEVTDPVGSENDRILRDIVTSAILSVCAWGNHGSFMGRDVEVLKLFKRLKKRPHCLKLTKEGSPAHPLYLAGALRPIEMATLNFDGSKLV